MKKLFFLLALAFFASCTRDLHPLIEVSLPSIEFSTPSVSAGNFPLIKSVNVATIDSLRGSANVSLNTLSFSVLAPESLTLSGITHAQFVVSTGGQTLTVFDADIHETGRNFTASTNADITLLLEAARRGDGKIVFAMSVTTASPTPPARWCIKTTAALQ